MYFKFFKLQDRGSRSAEGRRRNYAVLPCKCRVSADCLCRRGIEHSTRPRSFFRSAGTASYSFAVSAATASSVSRMASSVRSRSVSSSQPS